MRTLWREIRDLIGVALVLAGLSVMTENGKDMLADQILEEIS